MPTRDFSEILTRHRGPYSLICWRTVNGPKNLPVIEKTVIEHTKVEDPIAEALLLVGDPRDNVTSVDLWSEHEQAFVTTVRAEDAGRTIPLHQGDVPPSTARKPAATPAPSADAVPASAQETTVAKKKLKLVQTSKGNKPVTTPSARGGRYAVADRKFDAGKGEVAQKFWKAFLAMDGAFTVAEVAKRFKSLEEKMVGPYATHFKTKGGLKRVSA